MAIPKIQGSQRDFSAGELDVAMKRADEHPLFKLGARQMSNLRILNSRIAQNRPGRTALFLETGRTDAVLMSPGNKFFLVFGNGYLRVYNAAGAQVFTTTVKGDGTTAIPWTGTSAKSVVWTVALLSIYITYADGAPNNVPQVLTWDGVSQTSTWTLATYAETVTNGGQKQTPFYRISPQNVTMNPSLANGNITIQFSAAILVGGMVGTRMTYAGRQLTITAVDPASYVLTGRAGTFAVGQTVTGQTSGATGIIKAGTTSPLTIARTSVAAFQVGETITTISASATISTITLSHTAGTFGYATVNEPLPPSQTLTPAAIVGKLNLGDVLIGASTGAKGIIVGDGGNSMVVNVSLAAQAGQSFQFNVGDTISGSSSSATGIVKGISGLVSNNGQVGAETLSVLLTGSTLFNTSDIISNVNNTNIQGTVTFAAFAGTAVIVQLLPSTSTGNVRAFANETAAGPGGTIAISSTVGGDPTAISIWSDEVMNAFRGYPASVTFDQNRLIFSNIPGVPSGIIWSGIGLPTNLYVVAEVPVSSPASPIFELVPAKSQVYFVLAGPESGEFVFCDNRVYYIPITVQNPLIPGSAAFNILSSDGAANVQPRPVEEIIFYVMAGNLRVKAVIAPGAYYRPFNTEDTTENHTHLFSNIIALAAPNADATFPERYIYALNANGSLVVGKYTVSDGKLAGPVGWLPWSGAGALSWVSALLSDVIMWTAYSPNAITPVNVIEKLDDTQYLDGAMAVNNIPTALTPPGGKGPLWWLAGGSVTLMDTGARMMGTYQIDANGNIIPQFNAGENLSSAGLTAGQPWTATFEPFIPDAQPGQDQHQRMFRRRVSRMAVYVSNSTGFLVARLFSGPLTRTSPALGTIMNNRRFPTWNQDDDPTKPPPLREEVQRWRPRGRAYDPRVAVIKDTPGPLIIHEVGVEASI